MRREITAYKVKRREPFPHGNLYLDNSGMGGAYMGKAAATRNDAGDYPAYRFHAHIRLSSMDDDFDYDEEPETAKEIGYIKGWVIRTYVDGQDFRAMIDSLTCESAEQVQHMAHALCDEHGSWLEEENKFIDQTGDLLLIQEVYVQPKYRGYGVSLLAISHLMAIPGLSQIRIVIASKPFEAEQFGKPRDPLAVKPTEDGRKTAMAALGKLWSLLGFSKREVPGDEVEYWTHWTGYQVPPIKKVLPHFK